MKLNKYILAAIWVGMYILCAVLGFLPPQEGANRWLLMIFGILFFVPPGLLVYTCWKEKNRKWLQLVRTVALVVLVTTVALMLINLLSITLLLVMPENAALVVGDILYYLLNLGSVPMMCGQYWSIGMTGWAVLLWTSIVLQRSKS